MAMTIKVHAGDWGEQVAIFGLNWGFKRRIELSRGFFKGSDTYYLSKDIHSVEVVTEENIKRLGGTLGWGLAGGALLGPAGLLAGVLLGGKKKQVTFVCTFTDGKRILATTDPPTFRYFRTADFSALRAQPQPVPRPNTPPTKPGRSTLSKVGCGCGIGCLTIIMAFVALAIIGSLLPSPTGNPNRSRRSPTAPEDKKTVPPRIDDANRTTTRPQYEIIQKQDISTVNARRFDLRIRVQEEPDELTLQRICRDVLANDEELNQAAGVVFFLYLPDSNPAGHYTAGKATWAPKGNWANAALPRKWSKSGYELSVKPGNALGDFAAEITIAEEIPIARRKEIYHALLIEEDRSTPKQADRVVGEKYNLTPEQIKQISLEGVSQGWQ